jgi:hypothetical protein
VRRYRPARLPASTGGDRVGPVVGEKASFTKLSRALASSVGVADVAAACLRYATARAESPGYVFDSAGERTLDVRPDLVKHIGGHLKGFLHPDDVAEILKAIAKSNDRPLAAWCAAHLISLAMDRDFHASAHMASVHRLRHLEHVPVAAGAAEALYGSTKGLSARLGPERRRTDPTSVGGLALWRADRVHPYQVVIDRAGGEQFSMCLDEQTSLRIALIQPNRTLDELCLQALSPADEAPWFFGIRPHDEAAQIDKVTAGLKHALTAGAGIALLPELVMTESTVETIAERLADPGPILEPGCDHHTLRVVVSGSFHHLDADVQRNSVRVHFPRDLAVDDRQHSKSGLFSMTAPRSALEAMTCDHSAMSAPAAAATPDPASVAMAEFREAVVPTNEIRLYLGAKFSAVVVICADLLDQVLVDAVKSVAPSIVLVCNMTEKYADFASVAHEFIRAGQTTLVAVNNPARWFGGPEVGALVGKPLRNEADRTETGNFADADHILFYDFADRVLKEWPI